MLDVDVFHTTMVLRVLSQSNDPLIVSKDDNSLRGTISGPDLIQKGTEPNGFLCSLSLADVFSLASR